jgi:hypothetical protein
MELSCFSSFFDSDLHMGMISLEKRFGQAAGNLQLSNMSNANRVRYYASWEFINSSLPFYHLRME